MSESAGKTFRGLQEAYSSIYANKSENLTEDTIVSEVQEEEVIDPEVLVDIVVEQLINTGYVKTEDQALNIIPHIGDNWLDNIIESFIVEQHFIGSVNFLVSEGVDLSEYTFEELVENYFEAYGETLNENYADAGQLSFGNAALGALGAGAGLLKRAFDPKKTAFKGYRNYDYGQMSPTVKTQIDTDKPQFGQPTPRDTNLGGTQQKSGSTYPEFMPQSGDVNLGGEAKPQKPSVTPGQARSSQPGKSDRRTQAAEALKKREAARQQREAEAQAKRERLRPTREKLQHPKSKPPTQQPTQQSSSPAPQGPKGPKKPNPFITNLKKAGEYFNLGAKPHLKRALQWGGGLTAAGGIAGIVDQLTTQGAGRYVVGQGLRNIQQLGPTLRGKNDFKNW